MEHILSPVLELSTVIPGILLAYAPVRSYVKSSPLKTFSWILTLFSILSIGGGLICYQLHLPTVFLLIAMVLSAIAIYIKTLRISLWKSGTIAVSVCAVFACINSFSRALNTVIILHLNLPENSLWFCLLAGFFYNAICWLTLAFAYYPATHAVRNMIEDENFAQTWYVFWILPLIFISLNLFMIPRYRNTMHTGRVLQGYIVISFTLLILLIGFYTLFLLMADSLNTNAKLQQENHFLSMQQERYDSLKAAIEEARQARHDMRHHFNQLSGLAEEGNLEKIKTYLTRAVSRIPELDMTFCENKAADSVIGYYCTLAKREGIPFHTYIDLPEKTPIDEIDMCLILSNLLENALEASLKTAKERQIIKIQAYMHSSQLLLIQVENAYDGEIREKNAIFQSTKHKGNGVGLQSVRRIAEKSNGASTFVPKDGIFTARVMLCG